MTIFDFNIVIFFKIIKLYCGIDSIIEIVNPCDYNTAKHLHVYLDKCFMHRKQFQGP